MEAIAGITQRIQQIQHQIAQLNPAPVSPATSGTAATALAGSTTASAAAGSSTSAFNEVLTSALNAQDRTAAVGSGKSLVDAKGVPIELRSHGNGRVPASALSSIEGTGHTLWAPAARSFEALRSAASRDGVTIGITDSYRPYETQVDLVRRKGLYSQGGLAATPGTSDHGWGMALDLRLDGKAQSWMRANAADYGFVEDVPREPWHWHYVPTH